MRVALQHCNIPILNKDSNFFCSSCCSGMTHRLPYVSSTTNYTTPLELIFSDSWGLTPVTSSNRFNYCVNFADAHSKFTWLYFLKSKFDTLNIFKQWLNFRLIFKAMVDLGFTLLS